MCHNMTSPAWASVKLNITLLSAAKRIYLGTKSSISSRTCWVMFYKFKMRSCQRWSLLNWLIKHCTLHNNREQKLKHKLLRINWGTPPLFFLLKATKHKAIKQSSCRPPSFFFLSQQASSGGSWDSIQMTNESFMAVRTAGSVFKDTPGGFSKGIGLNYFMV